MLLTPLLLFTPSWVLFSSYTELAGYRRRTNATLWAGPQSFNLSDVTLLWSFPASSTASIGLSSGLTWALSPTLCTDLIPQFPERKMDIITTFLDCKDLRDAVATAFRTCVSAESETHAPHEVATPQPDMKKALVRRRACVGTPMTAGGA